MANRRTFSSLLSTTTLQGIWLVCKDKLGVAYTLLSAFVLCSVGYCVVNIAIVLVMHILPMLCWLAMESVFYFLMLLACMALLVVALFDAFGPDYLLEHPLVNIVQCITSNSCTNVNAQQQESPLFRLGAYLRAHHKNDTQVIIHAVTDDEWRTANATLTFDSSLMIGNDVTTAAMGLFILSFVFLAIILVCMSLCSFLERFARISERQEVNYDYKMIHNRAVVKQKAMTGLYLNRPKEEAKIDDVLSEEYKKCNSRQLRHTQEDETPPLTRVHNNNSPIQQ